MKQREARQAVMISARVRISNVWIDTQIRNVSSKGMMIDLKTPLPRGAYVEIARKEWRTAGRVAWFGDGRCGLQTQDRVRLAELASEAGRTMRAEDFQAAAPGRNRKPLWAARSMGRMIEMAALVTAMAGVAIIIADSLHQNLAGTIGKVVANL